MRGETELCEPGGQSCGRKMKFAIAVVVLFAVVVPGNSQTSKHSGSHAAGERVKLFRQDRIVAWSCASSRQSPFVYVAGLAIRRVRQVQVVTIAWMSVEAAFL